jgi:hypothetical protein
LEDELPDWYERVVLISIHKGEDTCLIFEKNLEMERDLCARRGKNMARQ